jgi:type II secretory pathway component PulM
VRFRADRKSLAAGGAALLCVLLFLLVNASVSAKRQHSSLREQRKEILALRQEYLRLQSALSAAENRKTTTKSGGIVQAVDELFGSMGLNQKVKSVKSTEARDEKYAVEEEAQVEIDKVSMNEMTNIFYRIENGPFLLSVRKATIRTSFESPTLLNITMNVDLIKPK